MTMSKLAPAIPRSMAAVTTEPTPLAGSATARFATAAITKTPVTSIQDTRWPSLPISGNLQLSGANITAAGTPVSAGDIAAGNLKFVPAANGKGTPYASFTFQVRDNGSNIAPNVNTDPLQNTVVVNVTLPSYPRTAA